MRHTIGATKQMVKISGNSDAPIWRNHQFFKGFTNYLTWLTNTKFNLYAFKTEHTDDIEAIATAMRSADALPKHIDWHQLADMTYRAQHWQRFYANQ